MNLKRYAEAALWFLTESLRFLVGPVMVEQPKLVRIRVGSGKPQ